MTAKITPLPTQNAQSLDKIDSLVRSYLAEVTGDNALVDSVGTRMKAYIEKYAYRTFLPTFNLAIPTTMTKEQINALLSSIEEGLNNNANQVQKMINNIIVERIELEIEMYYQRIKYKRLK